MPIFNKCHIVPEQTEIIVTFAIVWYIIRLALVPGIKIKQSWWGGKIKLSKESKKITDTVTVQSYHLLYSHYQSLFKIANGIK